MAFMLKIAEGKEAGKEFTFEQDSVQIGRTSDCDVVLFDPGVSRRHCRIFSEGHRYVVEDMGSANGTKVNGAPIRKRPLSDGDQVELGPVVFDFIALDEQEPGGEPTADEGAEGDANSTRILPRSAVRPRPRRSTSQPMSATRPQRASTGGAQALARAGSDTALAPRRTSSGGAVERPASSVRAGGLSAAERARIKRSSPGIVAQLKLFWLEASTAVRRAIIGSGVALGLGLVGLAYGLVLSGGGRVLELGSEPSELSTQPIQDSFGLGEGVKWERPDMKSFTWEYTAATRAVVILHFQAQGISQGELIVTVNSVDVGQVPPDTLASRDRSLEIRVPAELLKKGEPNRITFDNTKNPPGEDAWRIWNVWVEKALLPELPPDQLLQAAQEAYKRGKKNFDTPNIGARNRYEAWKSFREAWLMLEAHPEPKPDLYLEARDRVREAQQELDNICAKLMLEVEGYYNQGHYKAAAATLDHIRGYFPEFDQPCAARAENKRVEYGL